MIIENRCPISLHNVDYSFWRSRSVSKKSTSFSNTADSIRSRSVYWRNWKINLWYFRFTGTLNLKGYLVTIYIEKAFGSFSHSFLMAVLKKFDFGSSFLEGIEAVLKNEQSCYQRWHNTSVFQISFFFCGRNFILRHKSKSEYRTIRYLRRFVYIISLCRWDYFPF